MDPKCTVKRERPECIPKGTFISQGLRLRGLQGIKWKS